MNEPLAWSLAIAAAYLVGGVPFGLLLGKARGIDLRAHGSGNIGATNAMRVLGKKVGLLCFGLDVAKGVAPVLIAGLILRVIDQLELSPAQAGAWIGVAIAAVVGHVFPVYLRFKGGKGVATTIGAFAALWPWMTWPVLIGLVVWYAALKLTRYVSIASIAFGASLPITAAILQIMGVPREGALSSGWPFVVTAALLTFLVVWTHRTNIVRLRRGQEHRVGGQERTP